ncbi:MAG: alkene reductase [Myxococcales bacterium]|nr:alkene reductase [Myxococcales bacterium]
MTTSKLFEPYRGPVLNTPHRVAMAPMTRNRAGETRVPNELMATYYKQRASAALIVTEAVDVSPRAVGYPGTPGWYTDEMKAGWKKLVAEVRSAQVAPAPIFSQLFHTGRVSHTSFQPEGGAPLSPSSDAAPVQLYTAEGMQAASPPEALTKEGIAEVVAEYVAAARAAFDAGFDGIEINGGNGYLVDQFLKAGCNQRTDEYGGGPDDRIRFLVELVDAISLAIGPSHVAVRVSPVNPTNGVSDPDPQSLYTALVDALRGKGLAYLHMIEPAASPEVTRVIRERFDGTIVVNDGYDKALAEAAIRDGLADLVSFGKAFLANPDLPRRFDVGAPLNEPDPATFYGGTDEGYTSYPSWTDG